MNRDEYIKQVVKKLGCSKLQKKQIRQELEADILAAQESGESWADMQQRMGSPAALAAEFNENMGLQPPKSRKKPLLIILAAVVVVLAGSVFGYRYFTVPQMVEVGSSGYFTEKGIEDQAKAIVKEFSNGNYEVIRSQYCEARAAAELTEEVLGQVRKLTGIDWEDFEKYTSEYVFEAKLAGEYYGGIELEALYQNRRITYTMNFDEEMKLVLFYIN